MSGRFFCEKILVSQKFLLSFLGHWANNFQKFVLFCSVGPPKKQPMCPEVLCDEKKMFQRKVFFYKCFQIFGKVVSSKIVIILFHFCRGRFEGNFSPITYFIFSRLGAKTRLLKKHQVECENFILRVRRNFLRKNILFKVIWYNFSGFFERKILTFEKNFRRFV